MSRPVTQQCLNAGRAEYMHPSKAAVEPIPGLTKPSPLSVSSQDAGVSRERPEESKNIFKTVDE